MTEFIPVTDILPSTVKTADVEIFDPPMCCPTGMCGPTIDQTLLDLNEMVLALQAQGSRCGTLSNDQPSECFP